MTLPVVYIALPYTHKDPAVRAERAAVSDRFVAEYIRCGYAVYAPISMTHHVAEKYELPVEFTYWANNCHTMVGLCDLVVVITLDGWAQSVGVNAEVATAMELGIPVYYCDESDIPLPVWEFTC